ncbi:hypothetical protein T492DRAFT_870312, partial [Pavlovales sp. CCMP2436]
DSSASLAKRARSAVDAVRAAQALRKPGVAFPSPGGGSPGPSPSGGHALRAGALLVASPTSSRPAAAAAEAEALRAEQWSQVALGAAAPSTPRPKPASCRGSPEPYASARSQPAASPIPESAARTRLQQLRAERAEALRVAMQPMARASPSLLGLPAGAAAAAACAAAAHAENGRGYDFDAAISALRAASQLNSARAAKVGGTSLGGTARAIPTERDYELAREAVRAARLARQSPSSGKRGKQGMG